MVLRHFKGTVNIPRSQFGSGSGLPGLNKLLALVGDDKDAAIGLHCYHGNWALVVKTYLEAEGFTNVDNDGGWISDKDAIITKCAAVDECSSNAPSSWCYTTAECSSSTPTGSGNNFWSKCVPNQACNRSGTDTCLDKRRGQRLLEDNV